MAESVRTQQAFQAVPRFFLFALNGLAKCRVRIEWEPVA